ncbi:hypothetical protein AXX17_AT3G33330 [Arabidopsis thaliana]|uniref:Uncharacterized protein n=1 Tax=Arabidopsis thaliana TaxID=3702 RepID=A0A178VII9_ARATH|nr:hypothetical protein AXX17_AT3G33330 [Arabidopsis thaliana]
MEAEESSGRRRDHHGQVLGEHKLDYGFLYGVNHDKFLLFEWETGSVGAEALQKPLGLMELRSDCVG